MLGASPVVSQSSRAIGEVKPGFRHDDQMGFVLRFRRSVSQFEKGSRELLALVFRTHGLVPITLVKRRIAQRTNCTAAMPFRTIHALCL
jgi:hypothetical protein